VPDPSNRQPLIDRPNVLPNHPPVSTPSFHCDLASPLGPLRLRSDGGALQALTTLNHARPLPTGSMALPAQDPIFREATDQLAAYFAGERRAFTLALAPDGTDFQRRVWAALQAIPFGLTVSYRHIAESLGQPTASRAVGTANGRNPLWIIVPCHRVIHASGSLAGYAGGVGNKSWLLDHEQRFAS
jgi:methylated-DNA-[protein]-cysteine S-methyltransferase